MMTTQIAKYRALDKWFRQEQGLVIAQEISQQIGQFESCFKGDVLVQVGVMGNNDWLKCFKSEHRWLLSPDHANKQADMICAVEQLALETASVDLLIAPFCLEAFSHPIPLIEEFDRVLKPMGCLIFLGINPYSLWSMAAHLGKLNCFGDYAPEIHSPLRLQHRLGRLGYQQVLHQGFWYLPPLKQKHWINRLRLFNEMGKMLSPLPPGFYCHVARKYTEATPPPRFEAEQIKFQPGWQPG